ncbi:hypothetical protein OIU79_014172 [Salix purpurea]|uniref:Uncharacterized protein n=1 Tax=Salix purpurea TaxID=77065 RepID=A0A9Q0PQ63_SALPP|nr:hypothetical protein OIU79_014172 [Salix purpurea]
MTRSLISQNGEFSSTDSHRLIPGTGTKYSVEAACCKRHGLPFFLKGHPVTSCRKNPQIMSISVCHTFSRFISGLGLADLVVNADLLQLSCDAIEDLHAETNPHQQLSNNLSYFDDAKVLRNLRPSHS